MLINSSPLTKPLLVLQKIVSLCNSNTSGRYWHTYLRGNNVAFTPALCSWKLAGFLFRMILLNTREHSTCTQVYKKKLDYNLSKTWRSQGERFVTEWAQWALHINCSPKPVPVWQCSCVQRKVRRNMVCPGWGGRKWVSCTEPSIILNTLLAKLEYRPSAMPSHPTSGPGLTNAFVA